MELHHTTGLAFSRKRNADGSLTVYGFQAEGTPAVKGPRMVKIGHFDPVGKKFYIGNEHLSAAQRGSHDNVNTDDFDIIPFAKVIQHQDADEPEAQELPSADEAEARAEASREIPEDHSDDKTGAEALKSNPAQKDAGANTDPAQADIVKSEENPEGGPQEKSTAAQPGEQANPETGEPGKVGV